MLETDVLVIGAGPSGSVAASIIKDAGYDVHIIEKQKFPRFVIGESLLPRCLDSLERAGFMDVLEAKNFQVKTGAKFIRQGAICDFTFEKQFSNGRNYAWQMPRADFDKTLADECERKGVKISYEHEVVGVEILENGHSITTIKNKNGASFTINAKFIVDGSGYGRVIPRLFDLEKPSTQHPRKTIFSHFTDPKRLEQEEPDRIVIYVHQDDCWIWTIPFNTGITSLGFVSKPEFFEQFEGSNKEKLEAMIQKEPELANRFKHSEQIFETKMLQNWSATTDTYYGKGFVLTGNVTEFLDPIFSSGVTLATVSSEIAANLVLKHLNNEKVNWQKEYYEPMQKGVSVFRTYVNAWYDGSLFKVFFADNKNEDVKAQICSVLAGYVWDLDNPFVRNHEKSLQAIVNLINKN